MNFPRTLVTALISLLALCATPLRAQDLPTVATVKADATAAVRNGRVTRIEIDGGWKMEREAGFDFANLAKQAIIADKTNADGSQQQFNALVIYQRGAPSDPWRFDRLFSYGWKSIGAGAAGAAGPGMDATQAHALTLTAMRSNPGGWMPVDLRYVLRVDAFQVIDASIQRAGDNEYTWEIRAEFVVNDTSNYAEPIVKNLQQRLKVEAIQHPQTQQWILSKIAELESTSSKSQKLTRAQLESLPTLADAPFDQLYFGKPR
jgi:hypothetical protein